jgi:hypothetical protein
MRFELLFGLAVLGLLTLAMGAAKVFEDVVAHESGPVDTATLWFDQRVAVPG